MQSIRQTISQHRRIVGAATVGVVAVAVGVVAILLTASSSSEPVPTASPIASASPSPSPSPAPTPPPKEASPLNGVLIDREEFARLQQRAPLAVMIENDPAARPQAGFHRADLVYEAVSEGGITRLMAVFWRNEAERIQYIRSARVYYVQWAAELGAIYVHWGQVEDPGPVDVWAVLSRLNMRVLNGMFLGEAVGYRDPDRYAPHNVYSDTPLLWRTAQASGFNGPPTLEPWKFKEDNPANPAQRAAPAIDIPFTSAGSNFAVRWDYDPASNGYLRSMGGTPHTDAVTGERITARNVAVQFAVLRPSGVKAYNIIDTVGTGQAVVFQDGVAIPGTWRKDSEAGRTRFYDAVGNEITFNRGPTWIEVVPAESTVGY